MSALISWWARNSIAANLLMIAVAIAGIAGYLRIEREVFPSLQLNYANIAIAWPGASPREIEEQVILRVEEAISGVDGVEHVDSTANEGAAFISVEGSDDIDATRFLNDIKSRVDGISTLPRDAFPPVVQQLRPQQGAIYVALYGDLSERELNRLARTLKNELTSLPGGSPLVDLFGALNEEVSIEVSEQALRAYNLTFDDVARAIRASSVNISGGKVRTESGSVQVAARNLADTQQDFENIVIRQSPDGAVIRVRDVARVVDGFEDRRIKREMNGKPTITLAVLAPETLNIVELSRAVNGWVAKKNKELAGEAQLTVWFDTADLYYARMQLVGGDALTGAALVCFILVLFLRPVIAFWVTAGVVVSVAGSFVFMPAAGVSLNMLSLFAFLLVIGVLCDDAIVVGESIHNQIEAGKKGVDAAVLGAQLVAKPVIFAVLTTMIAFSPWLFISGGTSQFTKHITYTIIFALAFSLIEAFLILPSHLAHLKPIDKKQFFFRAQSIFADGILDVAERYYRPFIRFAIGARYVTIALFVVVFMVSVALLSQGWIAFRFMPVVQGPFLSLTVRMPEGAPFSRSLEIFDQVETATATLRQKLGKAGDEDYVKAVFLLAEEGRVTTQMTIVDGKKREESTEEVAEMLRDLVGDIPDAEEINVNFTINNGGADLSFGVESDDLEDLRLATLEVQGYLRSIPGVFDVRNSLQAATPELQIRLKPGAERFGVTLAEVTRQVRQAYYGEEAQRLPRQGQDVRVMVRYPADARSNIASIDAMRIRTADGRAVPLVSVADVSFAPSFKRIERRDRKRTARITAELREGVDRSAIIQGFWRDFEPQFRERHPGASMTQRGDAEEQGEFLGEFFVLYAMALLAMYMLIAIAFGSYWQPVLIMSAIPFGFMGAAFGHLVFGLDFALFSFFGVGAAAGVVINDNLVLIDTVNRLRAQGVTAFHALVEAGVSRFRPIVLTQITTFIGLLPIMGERSTDAQFLMPTIVSLAWGVFMAAFVTLIFVPAMYGVGADVARFYRWAWNGGKVVSFDQEAAIPSRREVAPPIGFLLPGRPTRRRYL